VLDSAPPTAIETTPRTNRCDNAENASPQRECDALDDRHGKDHCSRHPPTQRDAADGHERSLDDERSNDRRPRSRRDAIVVEGAEGEGA